jgi:hypothetical protein
LHAITDNAALTLNTPQTALAWLYALLARVENLRVRALLPCAVKYLSDSPSRIPAFAGTADESDNVRIESLPNRYMRYRMLH